MGSSHPFPFLVPLEKRPSSQINNLTAGMKAVHTCYQSQAAYMAFLGIIRHGSNIEFTYFHRIQIKQGSLKGYLSGTYMLSLIICCSNSD